MQFLSRWSGHLSILATLTHIFCCGLPFLATVASLSASAGGAIGVSAWHDVLHGWEFEVIAFAGAMVALSGVSLLVAHRLDCQKSDKQCCHEPCEPKKKLSLRLFIIATILFFINLSVYLWHKSAEENDVHYDEHASYSADIHR
jgi:hypothetical protein